MFKKEWIHCPVINKTRNTCFLFLLPFLPNSSSWLVGQDRWANWISNVIVSHMLCTRPSIFWTTAGPAPAFLVPIPCVKSHVLTYPLQKGNCNRKGQSTWFPLVHPCLYKQNTFTGQSSTITDYFRSPQQEWNSIYSVLVLATSNNPHVPLCARQSNY